MSRISDLELERFLTDDLDDSARARVAAAVAVDADLAAVVAERRAEQRAFFIQHPRAPVPPVSMRARLSSWSRLRLAAAPLAAAAAAVVAFVVVTPDAPRDDAGVRARGAALSARLLVQRAASDRPPVVFAHQGEPLRAGDAVRVEVDLARAARCAVVGVDARGVRALHYDDVAVDAGLQVLPEALVLDDSTGPEELVVVCDAGERVDERTDVTALAKRAPQARIAVLAFTKEPAPR